MFSVGIVGAGWVAREYHIDAYQRNELTEVVAVADLNEARREEFASTYGDLGAYRTADEMLADRQLDIVSICTPPFTHEDIFVRAADAGCQVFCEKPLATDLASARRMVDAAERNGTITQIGYVAKFFTNFQKAISIVGNGLLGDVLSATSLYHSGEPPGSWYFDPERSGGGVLADKLPHILDVYLTMFETEPSVSDSELKYVHQRDVEDFAAVSLSFDECDVSVSTSWVQPQFYSRHIVIGDGGRIEFNERELVGNVAGETFRFERGEFPLVDVEFKHLFATRRERAHERRIEEFVDSVADGVDSPAPIEHGLSSARTIDAIYDGAEE